MRFGTVFRSCGSNLMIHIISTSANIERNFETRKIQYLSGISSILTHFQINPYIIETVNKTDYLSEDFIGHSAYSPNKGVNELINIKKFFQEFSTRFSDDDDIIKTTLRYKVLSPYFLDQVKTQGFDSYCKPSTDIYGPNDKGVHTFLISMKYKCWMDFLENCFDANVQKDAPIEHQIAEYVTNINNKYLDKLDILANPDSRNTFYKV